MNRRIPSLVVEFREGCPEEVKAKTGSKQGAAYAVSPEKREHNMLNIARTEHEKVKKE